MYRNHQTLGRKGSAAKRYPTTPSADYLLTSPEQDSAFSIRSLAVMNLAICGIEADIGKEHADTFRHVQHPDLRADWQISNAEVRMWN
jgi:hypothetical protein